MAIGGKLAIVIGSGVVGSALSKEGIMSNVADIFSGTLKIVTKNLQQDKDNSRSTRKPETDSLLAQVNNLRQELQLLASSRSVTIITGSRSGSCTHGLTAIVVVGVVGYGYIWWKGWKLSDLMFVTRRGLSDACTAVGKQLEQVSVSISSARRHLSSRIDRVDSNIDECKELTVATKNEVSKLHGELSEFNAEVESVHLELRNLETQLGRIEGNQDVATQGVYHLCQFAQRLEQTRNKEQIKAFPSISRPLLELPQDKSVSRHDAQHQTDSLPFLALELEPPSPSPSSSMVTPTVLRLSTTVSASGLKELQEVSNVIKASNYGPSSARQNTINVSNGRPATQEPSSSPISTWLGLKLPGLSIPLMRTRTAGR